MKIPQAHRQEHKHTSCSHPKGTTKRTFLLRDLTYNFCRVQDVLTEQATRFAHSGTVSYAVLNELLGEPMRKGIFWLLKDISHHLFRASTHTTEESLDWCIGYAFHECVKLREDAFQRQHYTNRLIQIHALAQAHDEVHEKTQDNQTQLMAALHPLTEQTHESISRELARILSVFEHMRTLIVHVLMAHGEKAHMARLLVAKRTLVKSALGAQWQILLHGLYGDEESTLFLHAAHAFFESGRHKRAGALVRIAVKMGAAEEEIQACLRHTCLKTEEA